MTREPCRYLGGMMFWCVTHNSDWHTGELCDEVQRELEADYADRELQKAKDDE